MIEASFSRSSRMAAVSGVYQYDTGQRLRMNGLPSPDELLAGDDLITGNEVTVQAHFSHEGDEQTEMRLAQWNDERWCWLVDIPDEYLTRIEPVHVYVYVYHGEDGDASRARTEYEGVFSPISRPAPNNVASEDMLSQWAELETEVDLVLSSAGTAIENAQTHAESAKAATPAVKAAGEKAQEAEDEANAQIKRLDAVERRWGNSNVRVVRLPSGESAYIDVNDDALTYGIPAGNAGPKGEAGIDGPSDISLSFADGVLTITPK